MFSQGENKQNLNKLGTKPSQKGFIKKNSIILKDRNPYLRRSIIEIKEQNKVNKLIWGFPPLKTNGSPGGD